jgi:hypothetical protein
MLLNDLGLQLQSNTISADNTDSIANLGDGWKSIILFISGIGEEDLWKRVFQAHIISTVSHLHQMTHLMLENQLD